MPMASNNYSPSHAGQNGRDAWQVYYKDDSPQMHASSAQFQNQAEVAMSKPLQDPVDKNEGAGLAPWLGGITAILLVAFLIWRFTKKPQKPVQYQAPEPELPKFDANDRKMLDLACNMVEIDKNT